jgi:hypothetical protein
MAMIKDEIIKVMTGLSLKDASEIFYTVFENIRDEEILSDGRLRVYARYVIAEAAYMDGDRCPDYRLVAIPAKGYEGAITGRLTQSGMCDRCGAISTGFSKGSQCPVCDSEVDMT